MTPPAPEASSDQECCRPSEDRHSSDLYTRTSWVDAALALNQIDKVSIPDRHKHSSRSDVRRPVRPGHASRCRFATGRVRCPLRGREFGTHERRDTIKWVVFFGGSAAAMLVERRGWRARLSTRAVQHQEVPDKHTARPTSVPLHSQLLRRHQDTRSQRFFYSVFEPFFLKLFSQNTSSFCQKEFWKVRLVYH